ncbi:MAG: fatty acid desaturase, partial [Gemmataceae bacterium]
HFFVGGVNAHAAHHLFPHVSHAHYRPIAAIIEATAAEHGVPYRKTTLPGIIVSHFRFLHRMGQAPRKVPAPVLSPELVAR